MTDPTTTHARMTPHSVAGPLSSGSPMPPAWASPCVLGQLALRRPRTHAAVKSVI
jgi:hypothetical protein